MPQFTIESETVKNNTATITGADARHITTVLRLKAGDWLMLTDGKGNRWRAEIIETGPKFVAAKLALPKIRRASSAATVTLAQAIIKHDRFEWIVQKAVELGCVRVIPFTSERTIPKYESGVAGFSLRSNKFLRWQKIANEAAKQCGTATQPIIEPPVGFFELVKRFESFKQALLFWEGENKTNLSFLRNMSPHVVSGEQESMDPRPPIKTFEGKLRGDDPITNIMLIIGPEGGFSAKEVDAAKEAGTITCGLGPLILRVETAAIAALTLVQNKLGYFNQTPQS